MRGRRHFRQAACALLCLILVAAPSLESEGAQAHAEEVQIDEGTDATASSQNNTDGQSESVRVVDGDAPESEAEESTADSGSETDSATTDAAPEATEPSDSAEQTTAPASGLARAATCPANRIYSIGWHTSQIKMLTLPSSGHVNAGMTLSTIGTLDSQKTNGYNALALSMDGTTLWASAQSRESDTQHHAIYKMNLSTRQVTKYASAWVGDSGSPRGRIGGAINPLDGNYYVMNHLSRYLHVFDTKTGARLGRVAYIYTGAGANSANISDIAFDSAGNLYLTQNTTSAHGSRHSLYVVPGPVVWTGTQPTGSDLYKTPQFVRETTLANSLHIGGLAFGTNGNLYLGTSSIVPQYQEINPTSGAVVSALNSTIDTGTPVDLASCGTPPTLTVKKNITARAAATDQFQISIDGGEMTSANTATTTGTTTGVQANTVATSIVTTGSSYTVSETATSGSLSAYNTSWVCTNESGTTVSSGTGTSFTWSATSAYAYSAVECMFTNAPKPVEISVKKVDQSTPAAALAGATFQLWRDVNNNGVLDAVDTKVGDPLTTGATGVATWNEGLTAGLRYLIEETAAPSGYEIQGTGVYPATAAVDFVQITVENPKAPTIEVRKVDAADGFTRLAGAEFQLWRDMNENGTLEPAIDVKVDGPRVTPASGVISWTSGLIDGASYLLEETQAPTGYEKRIEVWPVTARIEGSAVTIMNPRAPEISLVKVDAGDEGNTLAGASFQLWQDVNGNGALEPTIDIKVDGVQTTPASGRIDWKDGLTTGQQYLFEEISAPAGFVISGTGVTPVTAGGIGAVQTITNLREPEITLQKLDAAGLRPPLAGATFQLWQDVNANGTLEPEIDTKVGQPQVTPASGQIVWKDGLIDGQPYLLQEISAPDGFVVDGSGVTPVMPNGIGEVTSIVNPRNPEVSLLKVDAADPSVRLAGAEFQLWQDMNLNGTLEPQIDLKVGAPVTTTATGTITWEEGLVAGQKYLIQELTPPSGYDIGGTGVHSVTATGDGTVITIENAKTISGILMWMKGDADTFALLRDSEWTLAGPAGPHYQEVTVTDCNLFVNPVCDGLDQDPMPGSFQVLDLRAGDYVLTETKAPAGYVRLSSPFEITLTSVDWIRDLGVIPNERTPATPDLPDLIIPFTGGLGEDLFRIGGALAFVAMATLLLLKRRQQRQQFRTRLPH